MQQAVHSLVDTFSKSIQICLNHYRHIELSAIVVAISSAVCWIACVARVANIASIATIDRVATIAAIATIG